MASLQTPPCPTRKTLHHDNLHGVLCAMTYAHTHPTSIPLHWTLHGQHHPVHPDITILISQSAVNNSRRHWSSMTDSSNDTVMGNTTQCMAQTRMVFQSRSWASLGIRHRRRIWRWIGMRDWHMNYESSETPCAALAPISMTCINIQSRIWICIWIHLRIWIRIWTFTLSNFVPRFITSHISLLDHNTFDAFRCFYVGMPLTAHIKCAYTKQN